MNKIHFNIKLTNTQKEIYKLATDESFKYLTIACSRQQGKSTVMMVLCVEWLLQKNIKIGYVCRTSLFAETGYADLMRVLPSALIAKANAQTKYVETIFGSSIRFFSAESGNSLRGQSFHYLINDDGILIATTPVSDDEGWKKAEINKLFGLVDGKIVFESKEHQNEFIQTEEHLKYIERFINLDEGENND